MIPVLHLGKLRVQWLSFLLVIIDLRDNDGGI